MRVKEVGEGLQLLRAEQTTEFHPDKINISPCWKRAEPNVFGGNRWRGASCSSKTMSSQVILDRVSSTNTQLD